MDDLHITILLCTEPAYTPAPFLVVPHYTWRGAALFPTYADGAGKKCATGSTLNCVQIMWEPMVGAYQERYTTTTVGEWSWMGTQMDGKTSAGAGLQYKRNRYYDPASGRFTQEDPLGLAGGLNAYGFANGDPVN